MDPDGLDPAEASAGQMPVRTAASRARVDAWALVLAALEIPHRMTGTPAPSRESPDEFSLWVRPEDQARARAALDASDREDHERAHAPPTQRPPDRGRPLAPLLGAALLGGFFLITGPRAGGAHFFSAGAADAGAIVAGQWTRAVTALTLHSDPVHLLGNVVAGLVFMTAVARWLGGGFASLLTLLAGILGNLATAYYHGGAHNSVGASTATFGALGILGGLQFVFRARTRAPWEPRGPLGRAWPVLAACLALFAMLGVGGGGVDVGAHVFGLLSGVLLGVGASFVPATSRRMETALGLAALAIPLAAWAARGGF